MTQLEIIKSRIPEANEGDLQYYLDSAKSVILNTRFPMRDFPLDQNNETFVESRYLDLQIRIAIVMYNKQGVEGESSHSENGIQRSYSEITSLLKEVTPKGEFL